MSNYLGKAARESNKKVSTFDKYMFSKTSKNDFERFFYRSISNNVFADTSCKPEERV